MSFRLKRPKEKAKTIRKILKQEFPKQGFRVRSDHSAVNIDWVDGASNKQVDALKLTHMENITEYRGRHGGIRERVHNDYIFTQRHVEPKTIERHAKKTLGKRYTPSWTRDNSLYSDVYQSLRDTALPPVPRKKWPSWLRK